jgi:probable DNA repair protein
MLRSGRQIWNSPDILPWSAWITRSLDEARARGQHLPRRLSSAEEWLLWRQAVRQACEGFEILMPDAMVDPVRRSLALADDYGLTATGATPEAAVLRESRRHFQRCCEDLGVLQSVSWAALREYLQPSERLLLAGFASIGSARRRWLNDAGARFVRDAFAPGSREVLMCESPSHEAEAAAEWCAQSLSHDPDARLLIVVPALAKQRHRWERAFSQRLDYSTLLSGCTSSDTSNFAIEGGRPLESYALVGTALRLLGIAAGDASFDQLSAVLRSPYLAVMDRNHSMRIDVWLRNQNVDTADLGKLRSLLAPLARELGEEAAGTLQGLLESLEAVGRATLTLSAFEWAQAWARLLLRCGWPGSATLSSDEQQTRIRFDELLGEFAAVAVPAHRLSRIEAYRQLQQMVSRVAFEPASDDVPITLTASMDDPVVRYDGVWVAGLTADAWPAPVQADPLLPLSLQRGAGIPQATASGQLQRALERQNQWQQSALRACFSWSRSDGDLQLDVSPILPRDDSLSRQYADTLRHRAFAVDSWLAAHPPALERWSDEQASALPAGAELDGGVRLLELQSQCPFRAVAELRLRAQPLPRPSPRIEPRLRGLLLHRAIELFWRELRDQASLRSTPAGEIRDLIEHSVARAFEQVIRQQPVLVAPEMLTRERQRAEKLMEYLVCWESSRPEFTAQILEGPQSCRFGEATLRLRIDRMDRLRDGRLVVIDYKTGKAKPFDRLSERPPQPQLPAYAVAAGVRAAAAVAVYLGREGVDLRGAVDGDEPLGRNAIQRRKDDPSWRELMLRWPLQLGALVQEYLRGEAAVRPQVDACEFCHLQVLCRIDTAAIPISEDRLIAEKDSEEDSA